MYSFRRHRGVYSKRVMTNPERRMKFQRLAFRMNTILPRKHKFPAPGAGITRPALIECNRRHVVPCKNLMQLEIFHSAHVTGFW